MTDRSSAGCPPESMVHDLVDDRLDADAAIGVRAHLAACPRCTALHGRMLALRSGARALPRDVTPPAELWGAIAAEIGARRAVTARRALWWRHPAMLAAAAVLLMALTAWGTVLVMRDRVQVASGPTAAPTAPAAPPAPAALRAIDRRHEPAIEELTRVLEKRRAELSPETVAAVERSLVIVDQALAEARAALAGDPRNATLGALVSTVYRQKVTVLRRAAELEPRS